MRPGGHSPHPPRKHVEGSAHADAQRHSQFLLVAVQKGFLPFSQAGQQEVGAAGADRAYHRFLVVEIAVLHAGHLGVPKARGPGRRRGGYAGLAAQEKDSQPLAKVLQQRGGQVYAGDAARQLEVAKPPRRPDDSHAVGGDQLGGANCPVQFCVTAAAHDQFGVEGDDLRRFSAAQTRAGPVERPPQIDRVEGQPQQLDAIVHALATKRKSAVPSTFLTLSSAGRARLTSTQAATARSSP